MFAVWRVINIFSFAFGPFSHSLLTHFVRMTVYLVATQSHIRTCVCMIHL